jgi:hypothetical protein
MMLVIRRKYYFPFGKKTSFGAYFWHLRVREDSEADLWILRNKKIVTKTCFEGCVAR